MFAKLPSDRLCKGLAGKAAGKRDFPAVASGETDAVSGPVPGRPTAGAGQTGNVGEGKGLTATVFDQTCRIKESTLRDLYAALVKP